MSKIVEEILKEICTKGSEYDAIIDNLITPNFDLKGAVISELGITIWEKKAQVEKIINDKYFKYWFVSVVKNQVHSSTSPFHKMNRVTICGNFDPKVMNEIEDETSWEEREIEYVKQDKRKEALTNILDNIKKTWFEEQMWNEYYTNNKTFRKIGEEYNINYVLVFKTVQGVNVKIKEHLKQNNIY